MTISAGTKIGPYDIESPLGSGGMGEVYRAHDPRLNREVAIKVLPETFSADTQRLHRFEQEARATASLNHPNILAVYDIGTQNGAPYIVSELLEGDTLRQKLQAGPLPVRRAVDCALQITRGLSAAHDKGVVHRDLKPENVFITRDGRVKILDFGLAKLVQPETAPETVTVTVHSDAGKVVGTVGYMSPEQVRGKKVDGRSDLFALGAILYEMLTAKRAFHGDTSADTLTAILTKDPPELRATNAQIPLALDSIVRHCLEKSPDERFQSARDVAFDLEMLSSVGSSTSIIAEPKKSRWRTLVPLLVVLPLLVLAGLAGLWTGKRVSKSSPIFTRLSYRTGYIVSGRFSSDGQTLVYSAGFGGEPVQIFTTRSEATQSRELGLKRSSILAISKKDEMLIALDHHALTANANEGTLAQVPLSGGAPREIAPNVRFADWNSDGTQMAVVRGVGGRDVLEYPLGTTLYETDGWISDARISPDGEHVAFVDHPIKFDSRGWIAMVDRKGNKVRLTAFFSNALGLAWHPSGKEVWFTASAVHLSSNLFAVNTSGKQRLVWAGAGGIVLLDIDKQGRVMLARQNRRRGIAGLFPGHDQESDLSWLDWSLLYDISPDGKWILFAEEGDAAGPSYSAYMRATDGSPAIRLGDGVPETFSPDGSWVAAVKPPKTGDVYELWLLPTRAGQPKNLSISGMSYSYAAWSPDGRKLLLLAHQAGHRDRWWLQDTAGGIPTPITPEGIERSGVTPERKAIVGVMNGKGMEYPIDGGQAVPLRKDMPQMAMAAIGADPPSLFYSQDTEVPLKVYRYDIATEKTELWKELMPADKAGVYSVDSLRVAQGGKWYAYSYVRDLSDLYMVEGLR